jgi:hypothetical protein
MRRLPIAIALTAAACGGASTEVGITFPDQAAHDATSVIAVTAFEPLLLGEDGKPGFVRCEDVGVFPPTRKIDPDTINAMPNLGRVLTELRENTTFPLDGDWSLDIPQVKENNPDNPWGAVMMYIEARGEVRAPPDQGGGQVQATLLSGCYCVRTRDGSHSDRTLDQTVKTACVSMDENQGKARELVLAPVMNPVFRLDACGVEELTSPKNQTLSPGPIVCASTKRCDDLSTGGQNCFRCTQPCTELDDLRNVPIQFTVDQPSGASEPKSQIVLSDKRGQARGLISVDDCANPIKVRAQVVGRKDTEVEFEVACVAPVSRFECVEEDLPSLKEPVSITTIPGGSGQPDYVAILYSTGMNSSIEVRNPVTGGVAQEIAYAGESARAIHGFSYELGTRPQDRARPALAVVTSRMEGGRDVARIYVYEWIGGQLVPQPGVPFTKDCPQWVCTIPMPVSYKVGPNCTGTQTMCGEPVDNAGNPLTECGTTTPCVCPGERPACGCRLTVEFQTEVTVTSADLDNDGRSDLAIATSSDLPITVYYSAQAPADAMYRDDGCTCSRHAQAPTTFELVNFGGPEEDPQMPFIDLVIGAPGGAFVKYGSPNPNNGGQILACGQPSRFGGLVPVRDLGRGRFQCNPFIDAMCTGYEDIVMVAAKSLGGGSFDDPGTIRVIFGSPRDLSLDDNLFDQSGTNVELIPRTLEGEEEPRDPRSVEVGDINFDGHEDLAVLFGSSEELHVWLGASNHGLGEVESGVNLKSCGVVDGSCSPLRQFALADFDGDGTKEIAVICDATSDARLRRYDPQVMR